jgi:hypothetical protein
MFFILAYDLESWARNYKLTATCDELALTLDKLIDEMPR